MCVGKKARRNKVTEIPNPDPGMNKRLIFSFDSLEVINDPRAIPIEESKKR